MGSLNNMKTWNVTVFDKEQKSKTVFQKQCKDVAEANEVFKEKKEEFQPPRYLVMREHY